MGPMQLLKRWWQDRAGATAIEYTLIGAIMATVIVASFTNLLDALQTVFTRVQTALFTKA
jgi:Flp pilus assembly pilin Flp